MDRMSAGLIAGAVATVPMTVAMELMHRQLPEEQQYPLPPREIEQRLTEVADIDDDMNEEEHFWLTMVSHFGYGSAAGAVYASLAPRLSRSPVVDGIGFGLALWAGSYLGLLPSLGILRPATEHPAPRNALMIAAHVVWGATAGVVAQSLQDQSDDSRRI